MIDLDELGEAMNELADIGDKESHLALDEVVELINRLRRAEKDATRYRWLRDTGCFEGNNDDFFHATPAQTDSAIDEAMQCK